MEQNMGLSNYPPGVTGNEPQISGEWPMETLVDDALVDLTQARNIIDDVAAMLDEQGAFSKQVEKAVENLESALEDLRYEINGLIPDEPEYDDMPYGYGDAEADRY
jgi:hypothetical protein